LGGWSFLLLFLLGALALPRLAPAAEPGDELEEILRGFEEEATVGETAPTSPSATPVPRFWKLSGSASLASSINYLRHRSITGTDYTGVQKLRARLNLQLDVDLPRAWKARCAGYGFYDLAYLLNGRGEYTDEVLDEYEWEADFQEVYVQGRLTESLDLKVGRQIVNWGRSETLRVLDVLNPLDEREPGLADIEDLRLAVAMLRLDYYVGDWTLTAVAIPEMRFDKLPAVGSDFNPLPEPIPERLPATSPENVEWALRAMGIFHGWDLSLQWARYWADRPYTSEPTTDHPAGVVKHSRLHLVGAGGNYTLGSWLLKGEVAYIDGSDYTVGTTTIETEQGRFPLAEGTVEKSRVDAMGGIEYYGMAETTMALDVVNRHINDYEPRMRLFDARENELETALRISADFMNARLHTTTLVVLFGERAQDGSAIRLSLDYELRDALLVGGGLLLFQNGDPLEFREIDDNDRIFLQAQYSF
jgi:hypothetical protein